MKENKKYSEPYMSMKHLKEIEGAEERVDGMVELPLDMSIIKDEYYIRVKLGIDFDNKTINQVLIYKYEKK